MMRPSLIALALVCSLGAATLPDAIYTEIAAGIPDGVLDSPGAGTYELTDAKPGLNFTAWPEGTVVNWPGVILKPTQNVASAVALTGGSQFTGTSNRRLECTGTVATDTDALTCHYITGNPCVSFASTGQKLRPGSLFSLADATGWTLCYWINGSLPSSSGKPFNKDDGGSNREMFIQVSGGAPDIWIFGGVTKAGGGNARINFDGTSVENGQWNLVAVYFNQAGNEMGASINGGAFTTLATTGTFTDPGTLQPFDIGARVVKLQSVWLWKGRVLDLSEVQAIYNDGRGLSYADLSAGQRTNLLHAWEMHEAAGAPREDAHGSNDLAEVSGPIAQDKDGHTGSVDRPLTDIMAEGDRVILRLGVQIYDAQEPKYSIFRTIEDITGNTITFDSAFGIACEDFEDSATMLGLGADPQKVGVWGGDGETTYIPPFATANEFGYYQRGFGTSHDIVLFTSGAPNKGITLTDLDIDFTDSTIAVVANNVSATNCENVRFERLKMTSFRGNATLFNATHNSGVDGFTVRGHCRAANFGPGTNYTAYVCALWGGDGTYFRNIDCQASGTLLFGGESGSIDTVVENFRMIGCGLGAGQTAFGQHFGAYVTHFQRDGVVGVKFRNGYFDTRTASSTYAPSTTAGFQVTNVAFAGGEFPDWFPLHYFEGYIRVGNRIFGPKTALSHNFTVNFAGGGNQVATMPTGLYRRYPVLTIASRSGLSGIYAASANLLTTNPTGTSISFENEGGDGNMQRWRTAYIGTTPLQTYLDYHKITFDPTDSSTFSCACTLTAEYFPEVTNDQSPRFHIQPSPGSTAGLLDKNGNKITL